MFDTEHRRLWLLYWEQLLPRSACPSHLRATQTHLAAEARKGCAAMPGREKPRILCVSRSEYQLRAMRDAFPTREYEVLSASTPEQAVAVCVSNHISAVVLDSEFSTDAGWSAAQTLKMVNPRLPVMLVLESAAGTIPNGVDAVAPSHSHILRRLRGLLGSG